MRRIQKPTVWSGAYQVAAIASAGRAANSAVWNGFANGGQICISVERVYVEEPVYDEFVAKVEHKLRGLRLGAPNGPGSVDVGAVTSPPPVVSSATG